MLIVLRKALKQNNGGSYFYRVPNSDSYSFQQIYDHFRKGYDFVFERCSEELALLSTIKQAEPTTGDVARLNRIIRAGGMVNYIRKLTEDVQPETTHRCIDDLPETTTRIKFSEDNVYGGYRNKGYHQYDNGAFLLEDAPETNKWPVCLKFEECTNTLEVITFLNKLYNVDVKEFYLKDIPKGFKRSNYDNARLVIFKSGITGKWYAKRHNNSQHLKIMGIK